MPTALIDNAAALAAGYRRVQGQYPSGIFFSRYEKSILAGPQGNGTSLLLINEEESAVSQVAADTDALAALNGTRDARYGRGAAGGNKKQNQAGALVAMVLDQE